MSVLLDPAGSTMTSSLSFGKGFQVSGLNTAWVFRPVERVFSEGVMICLVSTVETIPILLESDDACEGNGVLSM